MTVKNKSAALKALKVGYTMDMAGEAVVVCDGRGRIVYSTSYPPDFPRRRRQDERAAMFKMFWGGE